MLSKELQSILDNRLRYLPEITSKAIASLDWPTKVIEIGRMYGLHIDEIEELQTVVLKSMTGLASPADFEANLIAATAASPATIEKIISELNENIFEPIHEFVKNKGIQPELSIAHGIDIEKNEDEYQSTINTPSQSFEPLEIPASPEPKIQEAKPQVSGDFSEFFISTPTKTDYSMLK